MAEAASPIRGIWAAVVTPRTPDAQPDAAKALPYYRELLADGCDGLNVFGTTGEAMSFSVEQRVAFMRAIAQSGLPMDRVMTGTGAASLDDAVALTQCALDSNFAAVLLMPPFFYRDASDDGIVAFFEALFARVSVPPGKALLYNFPVMSGITFRPDLVDRLTAAFPRVIGGIKDSSNDRTLQADLHAGHPELAILPGSEHYLADALAGGAAGCISGSVALWPALAQRALRGSAEASQTLAAHRMALNGFAFIPAVRHRIAAARDDDTWRHPLPPLVALPDVQCAELDARFATLQTLRVRS